MIETVINKMEMMEELDWAIHIIEKHSWAVDIIFVEKVQDL